MILPDTNVLLYAHRPESPHHATAHGWLEHLLNAGVPFGMSDLVLSSVMRLATDGRIYKTPTTIDQASRFCDEIIRNPHCLMIRPGPSHWSRFVQLCRRTGAEGKLVRDAFLAALALEHDYEWITFDRGFARFPGLRWRSPLEAHARTNPL